MSPSATIHILGSGTPIPTTDRFGTSFAIKTENDLLMIDCGPSATWKLAKAGLNPCDVKALFLTHHHFDHNVDTPCLLLTRWNQSVGMLPADLLDPSMSTDFSSRF
jgi:ribonuclease Z